MGNTCRGSIGGKTFEGYNQPEDSSCSTNHNPSSGNSYSSSDNFSPTSNAQQNSNHKKEHSLSLVSPRKASMNRSGSNQAYYVMGHKTQNIRDLYTLGRRLGQGQFGTTYLCTEISTGAEYACKSISKRKLISKEDIDDVRREIQIMHHLAGHRNIVTIKGAYEDPLYVHIVMEICSGGELFDRIIQRGHYSERSNTLHPELCYSAIVNVTDFSKKVTSQKDVIELSLNITVKAVRRNYYAVKELIKTRKGLTPREKVALHDCLETMDETLDELHTAVEDLELYPNKKSLKEHAEDLKTLISSAITNQETCLDGFSHDEADKKVRKVLLKGQKHVEKMCSNALAMICNMTDTDIANEMKLSGPANNRKLVEDNGEWPEWLSAGDRRLLQSSTVTPDVVVAADGSGDYKTVSEAVAKAPEKSSKRYVIRIKAGVYRENVDVPKKKTNIMFMGDGKSNTIITASRNVQDGSTTFHSATVAAVGEKFLARDITFQNTAGASKHQAVALRVGSDLSAFYRCDMLAYQDTLYVHSNRQFFVQCLVAGTVDFIFGNGAAVFQDCDIHARRPGSGQKNMVTAQGRTDPNQNTGIVIQKCRIGATSDLRPVQKSFPTYLGRPWKEYSAKGSDVSAEYNHFPHLTTNKPQESLSGGSRRIYLEFSLGSLKEVWVAVLNITGSLSSWSFADNVLPVPEKTGNGPPSYICRLSGAGDKNWTFWLEANSSQSIKIDVAVVDQYLTESAAKLKANFPDWVDVTAFSSFISAYVF